MPFGLVRARKLETGQVAALTCKKWGCEDCGRDLKRRLRRAFVNAVDDNQDLRRFFTLTLRGAARNLPLEERYAELSRMFAKFRRRMARARGRQFAYALVREPHKDGTPHIHGLTDRFVPFVQLRQVWAACGGGMVDIRYVDPQRAAAYLSKYLSKDGNPPPKGCRKYASGGGVKLVGVRPKGEGGWVVESYGTQLDGQPGWRAESDPRSVFAWLARRTAIEHHREFIVSVQQSLQEKAFTGDPLEAAWDGERRERAVRAVLDDLQTRLKVCIICGADHETHPSN